MNQSPATADLDAVRRELAENPGGVLEATASQHGLSLQSVVEMLPQEMWATVPGDLFVEVMEDLTGWGDVTVIAGSPEPDPTADDALRWALTTAVLCNDAHVRTDDDGEAQLVGDPTEGALVVAARKIGLDPDAVRSALADGPVTTADELVRLASTLSDIRQEVLPSVVR